MKTSHLQKSCPICRNHRSLCGGIRSSGCSQKQSEISPPNSQRFSDLRENDSKTSIDKSHDHKIGLNVIALTSKRDGMIPNCYVSVRRQMLRGIAANEIGK